MHSPPKRPSLPLQNSSTARTTTVQPRSISVRSILSPSSVSEGCSSRQKELKGRAARAPLSASEASHKDSHIKANSEKSMSNRRNATVAPGPKSVPTRTIPTSKLKAATISSRPVSRATRRPSTPDSTSRNDITNTIATQKWVSSGHKLGPENWTPITAGRITTCIPPPRLRLYKHKRASVLPKDDGLSPFGPSQVPQSEIYEDVFYKFRFNSSLRLSHGRTKLVPSDVSPTSTYTRSESPEYVRDATKAKTAASPIGRHLKLRARAASKTVSWDPSVIVIGPKLRSDEENSVEERLARVQVNTADDQVPIHEPDIKDCVETIKQWGKADKSKLASLIEALKEMELNSQDITEVATSAGKMDIYNDKVTITTVQSLDPRVPDFQLPQNAKTKGKPGKIEELKRSSQTNSDSDLFSDSDSNKENIPESPPPPQLELQANPRAPAIHRAKKRTIAVLDDHDLPGREVNSFDRWYGDLQLREFAKKYPLTGSRALAVRSSGNLAENCAKTVSGCGGVRRVVSGGSKMASAAAAAVVRETKGGVRRREEGEGGGACGMGEGESKRVEEKTNVATGSNRADCGARLENPRSRRRVKPLLMDPSARLNAAIIQQRLEMLLLKEKERKAFEACLPELQAVMPPQSTGIANFGHWCWSGGGNLFATGMDSEGGWCNGEQGWVPSERLRL